MGKKILTIYAEIVRLCKPIDNRQCFFAAIEIKYRTDEENLLWIFRMTVDRLASVSNRGIAFIPPEIVAE